MAANPQGAVDTPPAAEKPEDLQTEFGSTVQPDGKAGSMSLSADDAHVEALTRKLLFKLDTRYALV